MPESEADAAAALRTRPVEMGDATAIADIYNPEVLDSTVTFDLVPRSLDEQRDWIIEHSGSYPAIVAIEGDGTVVGYASLTPYRPRPAYATTVESSVYVRRDRQGRGVGRLLMERLVEAAGAHGFHSIVARIVGGHDASIALHEKVGFATIGTEIEVGRKFGKWLDVVTMQRML
ncbi:MAG TPA: GNAT family N-acetyltransferase [Acidimicrobiia bacterium]|jgi:phosphinothricin acetyltransferase